jgi:hypothetical protein
MKHSSARSPMNIVSAFINFATIPIECEIGIAVFAPQYGATLCTFAGPPSTLLRSERLSALRTRPRLKASTVALSGQCHAPRNEWSEEKHNSNTEQNLEIDRH